MLLCIFLRFDCCCPFKNIFYSGINKSDRRVDDTSIVSFLKKGTTYSLKICAWCFCMDVLYISVICVWTGFVDLSMLLQLGSFEMSTTFGRAGSSGGDPVAVDRMLKCSCYQQLINSTT